jgi:chromosome segregation ATPase
MNINYESLQLLMQNIDQRVDELLMQLAAQQEEIRQLKNKNQQLENYCQQTVDQIAKYVAELEQIRSYYADSYHNSK